MTTCFGKELFIRFTVRVLCERLSVCVCVSFTFVSEGGMWDLIVLVPDHCLSFYFEYYGSTLHYKFRFWRRIRNVPLAQ